MTDADTRRLAATAGMTAKHVVLWQVLREQQQLDPTHQPVPMRLLADALGCDVKGTRRMVSYLERFGWVHREQRRAADGGPAPSRILATVPPRRDTSRAVDRLMRAVPCGAQD